jgi:4-diphosphocytidyl-2-C-methyl-D-erythritol kinase
LNKFWNLRLSREQLVELAAQLGSDVPFFLFGSSSVCTGRGEIVQSVDRPAVRYAVLIFPGIAMPTARVYAEFDRRPPGKEDAVNQEPAGPALSKVAGRAEGQRWASLSANALLPRLINDLEPAAFAISPELAKLRADLEVMLKRIVRMSGSGSTLFTLFDNHDAAMAAARSVEKSPTRAIAVEVAPQFRDDLHQA